MTSIWERFKNFIGLGSSEEGPEKNKTDVDKKGGGTQTIFQGGAMANVNYKDYLKPQVIKSNGKMKPSFTPNGIEDEKLRREVHLGSELVAAAVSVYVNAWAKHTKPYSSHDLSSVLDFYYKEPKLLEKKPIYLESVSKFDQEVKDVMRDEASGITKITYTAFKNTMIRGDKGNQDIINSCKANLAISPAEKISFCTATFLKNLNGTVNDIFANPAETKPTVTFKTLFEEGKSALLLHEQVHDAGSLVKSCWETVASEYSEHSPHYYFSNLAKLSPDFIRDPSILHLDEDWKQFIIRIKKAFDNNSDINEHTKAAFFDTLKRFNGIEDLKIYCEEHVINLSDRVHLCQAESFEIMGALLKLDIKELVEEGTHKSGGE